MRKLQMNGTSSYKRNVQKYEVNGFDNIQQRYEIWLLMEKISYNLAWDMDAFDGKEKSYNLAWDMDFIQICEEWEATPSQTNK